jgi:hypothetical protein
VNELVNECSLVRLQLFHRARATLHYSSTKNTSTNPVKTCRGAPGRRRLALSSPGPVSATIWVLPVMRSITLPKGLQSICKRSEGNTIANRHTQERHNDHLSEDPGRISAPR